MIQFALQDLTTQGGRRPALLCGANDSTGKSKGSADRPVLCPYSANRAHVKFGRRFRYVRPFRAAEILCMSKVAALFDIHAHAVV